MSRLRTWSLVVLSTSALGLAACGSSSSTSTTTSAPSATTTPATTAGTIPAQDRSPAGKLGTEPTVTVPPGSPPTKLESSDLIVGTGPKAKAGDTVTVQYVLATYSSDKVIQASWSSQPFTFTLDSTSQPVIPGWDVGVVGMQVGGRRELIIPPSLGYGNKSPGSGIAANDTLVFVIDLLKIG
ncbi:MAG TPA: FKBP-type peptidyl-prolyl cis-trans isomerase [Acidimicrobiales bacterium]|jgi:peptidylprolyl isomerase|nr:FKBP-type peptidyl-prolyl cis-trans isomerase [Acidimicrobiales bacterium]